MGQPSRFKQRQNIHGAGCRGLQAASAGGVAAGAEAADQRVLGPGTRQAALCLQCGKTAEQAGRQHALPEVGGRAFRRKLSDPAVLYHSMTWRSFPILFLSHACCCPSPKCCKLQIARPWRPLLAGCGPLSLEIEVKLKNEWRSYLTSAECLMCSAFLCQSKRMSLLTASQ